MPALLHEYWEEEGSGQFGPVSERGDRSRMAISPGARLVFSLRAATWFEAMQAYQERLGYGDYVPPDDCPDLAYTQAELAEQEAYLAVREIGEREERMDEHVKPQDEALRNSEKVSGEDPGAMPEAVGDGFCYWNDKKYSDGGTVCDAHQRFKCWNGRWVDIGNC